MAEDLPVIPPRSLLVTGIVAGMAFSVPGRAFADQATYDAASAAWERGDLDDATKQYQEALESGGLGPVAVLTAYARIGTYQAALGKAEAALSAFRLAASLDPDFQLPAESGPKAATLYQRARKDAAKLGGKLEIKAEVPTDVQPGHPFTVVSHLAESFAPLVDRIGIDVRDPVSGKSWASASPAEATVQFEVPTRAVMPGANLVVRVDALDPKGNRFASSESHVKVSGGHVSYESVASMDEPEEEVKKPKKAGGGFWSSPWPYAIGGAIVLGTVGIYAATRPTSDVTVAAPTWR